MYQPLGFSTREPKMDGRLTQVPAPTADDPTLSWVDLPERHIRFGCADVWALPKQRLITINDNRGALFDFERQKDGSYRALVEPGSRMSSVRGAIGEVRVTDASLLLGTGLALPGGVIHTEDSVCPSGTPAMHSFAEALRRGAQYELDIDPGELTTGVQPREVNGYRTALVYVADTLANGAGYAVELGETLFENVLRRIVSSVSQEWRGPSHRSCDAACPDCLRSWDNQRVHGYLDWRLALEVTHLLLGHEVPSFGWSAEIRRAVERFDNSFGGVVDDFSTGEVKGIPTLATPTTIALVGHPLWPRRHDLLGPGQLEATKAAEELAPRVFWTDPRELLTRPDVVWTRLMHDALADKS